MLLVTPFQRTADRTGLHIIVLHTVNKKLKVNPDEGFLFDFGIPLLVKRI
jgi:hypothetical protein